MTVKRLTTLDLKEMKQKKEKITMITAYDYPTAQIADEAGVETILVGDSWKCSAAMKIPCCYLKRYDSPWQGGCQGSKRAL